MPFTYVAGTFDEQVLHAIGLVRAERYVSAAAVIGQLREQVERAHLAAVVAELERKHADNAIAALELIQDIYRADSRPRLRLVVDR